MSKNSRRIPWDEADKIAEKLSAIATLKKIPPKMWDVAGSYRRKRESCGDIDLCIREKDYGKWAFEIVKLAEKGEDVLVKQKDGTVTAVMHNGTRIEFYIAPEGSYGAMLMFCTGSWELNVAQRTRAIFLGMKLNDKGVYVPAALSTVDNFRRVEFKGKFYEHEGMASIDGKDWIKIAGKTEADCYRVLEMEYLEPKNREV